MFPISTNPSITNQNPPREFHSNSSKATLPLTNLSPGDILNLYLESLAVISKLKEESKTKEAHLLWQSRELIGQGHLIQKLTEHVKATSEELTYCQASLSILRMENSDLKKHCALQEKQIQKDK